MSSRSVFIKEVERLLFTLGYVVVERKKGLPRCVEIQAEKDGVNHFFAVMVVEPNNSGYYFDSTNSTEWKVAQSNDNRFHFVLLRKDVEESSPKRVVIMEPDDVLRYSSLTSFKINLNIPSQDLETNAFKTGRIKLRREIINNLIKKHEENKK